MVKKEEHTAIEYLTLVALVIVIIGGVVIIQVGRGLRNDVKDNQKGVACLAGHISDHSQHNFEAHVRDAEEHGYTLTDDKISVPKELIPELLEECPDFFDAIENAQLILRQQE